MAHLVSHWRWTIDRMHLTKTPLPSYFKYWGKARPQEEGPALHLLPYHCLDVAAVGHAYLRRSPSLLAWLAEQLGNASQEAVLGWVTFWLSLHDLGKFSISFQGQRADLVERLQDQPPGHFGSPGVRHDSLGMQFWTDHLELRAIEGSWFGNEADVIDGVRSWVRAVTGHHGQPPLNDVPLLDRHHYRPRDTLAATHFVDLMRTLFLSDQASKVATGLDAITFERVSREVSWWMAGIAVLADWIGSNSDIFRYRDAESSLDEYWLEALQLADKALHESGVLAPARQSPLSFDSLFPAIQVPAPLQQWAATIDIAPGPQIHLLEDVTGAGKTEAAVMLTHRLIAGGCADGFFIGLPTMATANAMYGRIASVVDKLFPNPETSLVLAHARKNLVEVFAKSVIASGRDEGDVSQHDESATHRCARWLADHNKRALLSPAGVGTVDQALLGALQSKHQSLRLLGLARKVLVIDEVHACDEYMQRTLEVLLEFHARAGGSAVLLSATLTGRMKSALLKAFAKGLGQRVPSPVSSSYPLATSWAQTAPVRLDEAPLETRPDVRRTVEVRYESDRSVVVAGIVAALATGQCVAWIRNTVGDAIDARAEMAVHMSAEKFLLFHAKFTLGDRLNMEDTVLQTFGRDSTPVSRSGRLLIATQVAEQSLDVDFDLVVTDLAPIDRVIQRAGRLRRHVRDADGLRLTAPSAVDGRGTPCLWVLGPVWEDDAPASWFRSAFPRSNKVYPHHGQLWLTAGLLRQGQFTMPDDGRRLIELVFGDDSELPAGLQKNATLSEGQAFADKSMADFNSVTLKTGYCRTGIEWSADTVAPSRLGEDTVDVLLGRWEGDVLNPWCDDRPARHAWAYSTVRVAKRSIASIVPQRSPVREAALQAQRDMQPGGGEWVLILAFDLIDGRFVASARGLTRNGDEPPVTTWIYDAESGLRAESQPNQRKS